MSRRRMGTMDGERYLGNLDKLEVHDLDRETPNCQIDQIIAADREVPFQLFVAARSRGYAACRYCIGDVQTTLTSEAGGVAGTTR